MCVICGSWPSRTNQGFSQESKISLVSVRNIPSDSVSTWGKTCQESGCQQSPLQWDPEWLSPTKNMLHSRDSATITVLAKGQRNGRALWWFWKGSASATLCWVMITQEARGRLARSWAPGTGWREEYIWVYLIDRGKHSLGKLAIFDQSLTFWELSAGRGYSHS